ncbi:response regulator [Telmatospirillum siberiense]|uniref:DNA-binding response regulator n=1 Tax=Telmatospirillum siberiense TaxID=382514 RepID=A0A2N3PYA9_9PROT|nr:response regulator [Telmatospirillum siberiense]PKU25373.1 DNA-binding response regulator [Telmatospirillum siberiense]
MGRILVVDDEPQIRKFLRISLGANGHEVLEAETAGQGEELARTRKIDLVILDLGLPDVDGQEIITTIRETSKVPIIVLSVRSQEVDKVEALDRGADDYIVKPFGIGELMARVRAALRQRGEEPANGDIFATGGLQCDFARRVVTRDGEEVHLSKREYELLRFLASSPDHVLTHKQILKEVWGPAHVEDTAYLRVYVNQLRQKLETDPTAPRLILTEPGVGYRLVTGA